MLELVAKHRPEGRGGDAGKLVPDREPMRAELVAGGAIDPDRTEDGDGVGPDDSRRMQVGERGRAGRPCRGDDEGDDRGGGDSGVLGGGRELAAQVLVVGHRPSLAQDGRPDAADILEA